MSIKILRLSNDVHNVSISYVAEIFGALADGSDMTEKCKTMECNFLKPDDWMCFSVPFAQK